MNHRYDFIYLFDVKDANPNGDPDAGNLPRIDPETGHGIVTDVCLKRKIRNYVGMTKDHTPPFEIYVKEKAVLNNQHKRAYEGINKDHKTAKQPDVDLARAWMCKNFYDIRSFGAVMTTEVNCGQVRGPVQIAFARSMDSIVTSEHAVTRCAVTTEKEAEKQSGDNRTMGRKFTVPYALYRTQGYINPYLAKQTGFGEEDLELLFTSLEKAFDLDPSAARPAGSMSPRKLIVFKHASELGSAPAHKLFEALEVKRKDTSKPARCFDDYEVILHKDKIPTGIEIIERI